MTKQLANLVKIAKQKLDTQEKLLIRNQTLIMRKKSDIDSINATIASTPLPSSGSFNAYQNQKAAIQAHLYEIEEIQGQIALLRQEQEHIKAEIRIAHIEHEKMLHLYNKAKDEEKIELNKKEVKKLDETTLMLHIRQKIMQK
ncbi:hypothetical protein CQA53_09055 [Helicobacter didelphidarum]|uniref:Flagellar FliJ protein n=1 Tax=Helicobacter didelphidarum TaxID=2040648 RepID=A0A3D8ICB5_9HELI|nr:flagellar export protein FliJ [Helicobacter didelphidarum]RDU62685.1 hypothetical protein CQA53_09055 [Helicobacter didelphidarum]